jgi:hypothetical protein
MECAAPGSLVPVRPTGERLARLSLGEQGREQHGFDLEPDAQVVVVLSFERVMLELMSS